MLFRDNLQCALAIAAAAICLSAPVAVADMTVFESDDPKIAIGTAFPDDAIVDVAPGKTVKVHTADNKTKVFRGDTAEGGDHGTKPIGGARDEIPDD